MASIYNIYDRVIALHEERKRKSGGASFVEAERDILIDAAREAETVSDLAKIFLYMLERKHE